MPAVLTHKTIMLMARERIAGIRDALSAKNSRGPMSDLEHRVWYLADKAHRYMTDTTLQERHVTFPLGADYVTPFGQDVSPYAVMGSMGPDITGFSAMFARGQGWVFDTIHKGNPDANKEPVVARTTDFALAFWGQVAGHEAAGRARGTAIDQMRAYVLGHLCHVAGDVLSHPFINDLEWHQGNRTRGKFSHGGGEGSIDARVAQKLLLRRSTREGQAWDLWWPTHDEVPDIFWASYTEALDQLHQMRSLTNRPKGYGEFEARFTERGAPAFSLDFVKDGYHLYRNGIVSIGYGYGYGSFFGALVPLVLPLSFAIGLSGALPHSRSFFSSRWQDVDERGWFELLTLPLAITSIVPVFYGIWAATLSTRGAEGLTGAGLAFAFVNLILAVVFFSTVGTDLPWWSRWLLMFAPMMAIPLVFSSISLGTFLKDDGKKRGGLTLIYGLPFILWVCFILIFLIIVMGLGSFASWLAGKIDPGASTTTAVIAYVVGMLGLTAGLIVLWVMLPKVMRDAKIPEFPKAFPADRPHYVRLFDDSTLAFKPSVANVTAQDLFYPSERRPLLKLWFTGGGDLWVRSEQRQLAFSTTGTGAPFKVVPAPVTPMTLKEYGQFLEGQVANLHAVPVYPADEPEEYHLPTGATFSEEVNEDDETKGLPEDVVKYKKLAKAEADAKYLLRHADKPYQAIRFGTRGAVETAGNPQDEYTALPGTLSSSGATVTGTGTLFGYFFDPGDQIAAGTQVRTVTLVSSDTELQVSAPFSPALSGAAYVRLAPEDSLAQAPGKVTSQGTTVTGTQGTQFTASFGPGDFIVVGNQVREVTKVVSNTQLEVADKFGSRISSESDYMRLITGRERVDGYPYVSTPASARAVGGGSVMDFAADFAVLLCLGMTSHLLPEAERQVPTLNNKHPQGGGPAVDARVGKVYQVFRNWSLDRRRLNEWKMMVAGGARTEKSARDEYDATMTRPPPRSTGPNPDWAPANVVTDGEPVSNAQGWVPVLRQWMARVAGGDVTDTAAPAGGGPTSMSLSQAMAFLLDLKAPVRLAP